MIADIHGGVCEKKGINQNKLFMENIKVVPANNFNIFSLKKRKNYGYLLMEIKNIFS